MRASTLLVLGLLLSLSGCTIEAKGLGAGRSQSQLISGRVFDSEENVPLKGATVKTADGKTATTDDNGEFTIEASPGKSVLTIEEADHAKGVKEVDVYADAESYVEMFAKPVDKDSSLDAATGGDAKVGAMTVRLPPDALEDESGVAYNGKVTIEVATVRPENAQELSAFPGKFDGTTVDMMAGSVATQAAASIRLLNAAGRPLRMRPSQQVEIFLPIRPAVARRSTRLWKLREQSADWEEVGFQAVRDVEPMTFQPALRTAVSALTWWNAGEPFVKSRIQGCLSLPTSDGNNPVVGRDASFGEGGGASLAGAGGSDVGPVDAGAPRMAAPLVGDNPLAGIQVVATGIGYGYFAEHYTNADGCFDIEVKANGPVALYAQKRMLRSQPRLVTGAPPGETLDVGMLPLGARAGDCPGVMQDCGGVCVNTFADDNNCGGCGSTCAGEVIDPLSTLVPLHCVYGSCGCDDSDGTQESCGGACANVQADVENCGYCGNSCTSTGSGNECVDGACMQSAGCVVDADCGSGMTCDTETGVCAALPACGAGQVPCNGGCVPADPGCGGTGGVACGGRTCNSLLGGQASSLGFGLNCCAFTPDGDTCGITSTDPALALACASTDYAGTPNPTCPSAFLMTLGLDGAGCCRSDGQCGVILSGSPELGCILNAHAERDPVILPPTPCTPTSGADAGVMPMPDAGL